MRRCVGLRPALILIVAILMVILSPWVLHKFWCKKTFKKTLVFGQNLENKGPEIFPPARSMVLKVVRGKILETLKLACSPTVRVPLRHGCNDRIVKDLEYLADNMLV